MAELGTRPSPNEKTWLYFASIYRDKRHEKLTKRRSVAKNTFVEKLTKRRKILGR